MSFYFLFTIKVNIVYPSKYLLDTQKIWERIALYLISEPPFHSKFMTMKAIFIYLIVYYPLFNILMLQTVACSLRGIQNVLLATKHCPSEHLPELLSALKVSHWCVLAYDAHHEKTVLLSYPKKDWWAGVPPILLWVWHRLQNIIYEGSKVHVIKYSVTPKQGLTGPLLV